jgi:hypothetical protein
MGNESSSSGGIIFSLIIVAILGFVVWKSVEARRGEGDWRLVKNLPPSVQGVVARMDATTQTMFFNELETRRKSLATSYLLLLIGWHYVYLNRIGMQFAFWFTGAGAGIWWFVDLFRLPSLVRGINEQRARETIQTLAMGTAFGVPIG